MLPQKTIKAHLNWSQQQLLTSSTTATIDSELLLGFVLKKDISWLYAYPEQSLTTAQSQLYQGLVAQCKQGKPVAYILGSANFWSLDLSINDQVLIPRPETELLIELILQKYQHTPDSTEMQVLDLGCGSGAIGLAIACEKPNWHITGLDISPSAVTTSNNNATKNKITNFTAHQSDLFAQLPTNKKFDIIVSNPPYLAKNDPHLTTLTDPNIALVAGDSGLETLYLIIEQAGKYLNNNGILLLEHGYNQAIEVATKLDELGFKEIATQQDLNHVDRVTWAIWK